ncbi:minor histocompatibility antigen H13 [Nematocida sp. AWRm80]|nr:minor histocompatibility antigen H13 [Nematocida sp. AWRm80]
MLSGVFLISVSSALLWLGTLTIDKTEKREIMSSSDAKTFPIMASCVLVGLFAAMKYLSKEVINTIFGVVFSLGGVLAVYKSEMKIYNLIVKSISYPKKTQTPEAKKQKEQKNKETKEKGTENKKEDLNDVITNEEQTSSIKTFQNPPKQPEAKETTAAKETKETKPQTAAKYAISNLNRIWSYIKKECHETKEELRTAFGEIMKFPNFIFLGASILMNSYYIKARTPWASNILACAFAMASLQEIKPDSIQTVLLLLGLLFVYDIFWVYCTNVMVTVAKGLNLPIKIVYPWKAKSVGMIGLGDIVIPGVYLGIVREFATVKKAPWVFKLGFLGYILALIITFLVAVTFKAGQPALLYICPIIVGGSLAGAKIHKKVKEFLNYTSQ